MNKQFVKKKGQYSAVVSQCCCNSFTGGPLIHSSCSSDKCISVREQIRQRTTLTQQEAVMSHRDKA